MLLERNTDCKIVRNVARIVFAGVSLLSFSQLSAQDAASPPAAAAQPAGGGVATRSAAQAVLTLEQCIDAALTKSDSAAILEKTLGIAQAQYKQTVAKNTLSLNAGLGGGATGGLRQ